MELVSFIAESAADAATKVRERLGATAVVVNVRPMPPVARTWFSRKRPRFEILAYRPEAGETTPRLDATSDAPAVPSRETVPTLVTERNRQETPAIAAWDSPETPAVPETEPRAGGGGWRIGGLLEASGFLASNAQRVVDELRREHGDEPPVAMAEELRLARAALTKLWRAPAGRGWEGRPHVLIGPPGTGKTTCLCKWLTQVVLGEGRPVRVWRLDGQTANTGESLSVYCEILGVPLERVWAPEDSGATAVGGEEMRWVDLPGVDYRSAAAVEGLRAQIEALGAPVVHLVVNGAYDTALLLRQVRAFSRLPIDDVVVTHLDEESRWGKIWNLVLGTNFSVRFLSAGQNIPGEFLSATAEQVMARQFPA
ncbi:MAG: hypothetical protein IT580_14025 [Verrucomicrobiales bacterium]|nr:hypothetical protein [Verrucomicrobiales bacterium]